MRRVFRAVFMVLLAYLVQATILPYFKIAHMMLDLLSITLYTIGYAFGLYGGLMAGGLAALIMEVSAGDLAGLISVFCVLAGAFGAWTTIRLRSFRIAGKRRREQRVKQFAPMVAIALFVMAKELVYVGYFYITGMDMTFWHIMKAVIAGLYAGGVSLVLLPLIYNFLVRSPEETMLAKWAQKRKDKNKERQKKQKSKEEAKGLGDAGVVIPAEGGTPEP